MKLWKRLTALCLSALVCVTLLTACGRKESADGRASLSVCVGETPATYDPIYAQRIGDQTILNHLYENLMRLETGENSQAIAVPGAAKSVDMKENSDGTVTYTFRLRGGKWSDGVEVKASDFVYAWQRLADPATGSVYAPAAVHCQRLCGGSGLRRHKSAGGERKKQHHPCGDPDRSL